MTIAIHENRETVQQAYPVRLTCKFLVDQELVLACQTLGTEKTYRGVPVGTISSLHPWGALRERALDEGRQFLHYMGVQDYEPQGDVTDLQLWGPYMEKIDWSKTEQTFRVEEMRGDDEWHYDANPAYGYRSDEVRLDRGCAYLLHGLFLARYGHVEEMTGALIV